MKSLPLPLPHMYYLFKITLLEERSSILWLFLFTHACDFVQQHFSWDRNSNTEQYSNFLCHWEQWTYLYKKFKLYLLSQTNIL